MDLIYQHSQGSLVKPLARAQSNKGSGLSQKWLMNCDDLYEFYEPRMKRF